MPDEISHTASCRLQRRIEMHAECSVPERTDKRIFRTDAGIQENQTYSVLLWLHQNDQKDMEIKLGLRESRP
jgi:hypothetical protein